MSVLKNIIPGSAGGVMGPLGKFVDLPDVRNSLFAAYVPGSALGAPRESAVDKSRYIRDKSGAGRHGKIIRPAGESEVAFLGYTAGKTLNVTSVTSGTLKPGMMLSAEGIASTQMITQNGSGVGGTGDYSVGVSQNLFSSGSPGSFTASMVGTKSLFVDPAHFLELPYSAQDIASANGEITIISLIMHAPVGNNLPIVSDYDGSASAFIISDVTTGSASQSYTRDGAASATSAATGFSFTPQARPAMVATIHTRTRSDSFWRLTGVGSGSYWNTAAKPDGVVGGTAKLRLGTSYDTSGNFAMPGQVFATLIYNKALTQAELDNVAFPILQALAAAQGWGAL